MSASDIALRVEGLGKQYRLGPKENSTGGMYRYKSLRDSLGGIAKRPVQTIKSAVVREPMNEDNSFWALKDINFEVKKGEVVGIIGRNGAGKSTLLKILSRITKPTTGRVDLYGRVGSLLEVGTGFHPELTGRENIYLNGAILGMTRAEVKSRFDEIVAFSEIEKFLDTPVKQYSSGMYMRLAFAVAAHLEPEILVVDEVLAVGDATFQKKCLGKMKDVAEKGRTVLFVSHNMGAIGSLCSIGCLLATGKIELIGAIHPVIGRYMAEANVGTETTAAEVVDQRCIGPGKIIRCGVMQSGLSNNQYFRPDRPIRVYADLRHDTDHLASFGIRVRTGLGQEILHITSQDETEMLRLPDSPARLLIDVPPIPLNDGDYYISFFLCDRSFHVQHQLIDAVTFTVETSHLGHRYADALLKVSSQWGWTAATPEACIGNATTAPTQIF